ncbi:MAG: Na-K-Cl cotransporter [Calditrichaeota bacterium]|nr:Na-K-Cl cotransporter [Calditrichota bacterium]MCB9090700.1 Na-K-Cl cotransporter [Calditrichia bacterium]
MTVKDSNPDTPPPLQPEEETPISPASEETPADEQEITTAIDEKLTAGRRQTAAGRKFGTFSGVIRPTILTILGVMMYLREGWVVGNAGLGGALLIILMAYFITGTTALSLSSITTNIRLGAGGVFTLATQSLGLEVGGSIGIPFYLAQSLSVAMYVYGFMEGWIAIFPTHHPLLVVLAVFAVVFLVSYISTTLAFRIQVLVMSGVILALTSIYLGLHSVEQLQEPQILGKFEQADYWTLFAIFFPAATGIMVGASMSGSLKNPRSSIPLGTMTAWVISLLIYVTLAIWYSLVATPEELVGNLTIAVDRAFWGPAVLIGILSSCFTAALSSFVASPRTLQALGQHKIMLFPEFFGKLHGEEPRNAILFTGGLVLFILLVGDLNAIAQIVTVFFLMTYFTINFILVIEKKLNLISFRPTFRVPVYVPFFGSLACLTAIVIVSPAVGLICILLSITIYFYLDRRSLETPYETLNSGLFLSVAKWAATKVAMTPESFNLRSWKPDILFPVERSTQLEGNFQLLLAMIQPQGSIQVVGLQAKKTSRALRSLPKIITALKEEGVFASAAVIESSDFLSSLRTTAAVMRSSFFRPNILFVTVEDRSAEELKAIIKIADENSFGVAFIARHPDAGMGKSRDVNIWIRDQSPNWQLSFDLANIDLPLLIAFMLIQNWRVRVRLISLVAKEEDIASARSYLADLMNLARMPNRYEIVVEKAELWEFAERAPHADLNILGLADVVDKTFIENMVVQTESSCMFVRDSGHESVLV